MKIALFMIDGWLEPPKAWNVLSDNLLSTGAISVVYHADRKERSIRKLMETKILQGYRIIGVGHSFGAAELAKISQETPLFAAAFIDPVNEDPMWSRNWLNTGEIPHAHAYRRKYRDFPIIRGGPPSVGVLGAANFLVDCGWGGHNRIISHITSELVFWVKQICREEPQNGRAA